MIRGDVILWTLRQQLENTQEYGLELLQIRETVDPMSYSSIYEQVESLSNNTHLVIHKPTLEFFVAKKLNIYEIDQQKQNSLIHECKLLKDLNHPHILRYKDILLEGDELIQVLEYCEEGDLQFYLKRRIDRKQYLSEKLILNWLLQLLMGLQYIHQNKIIHRGISLKNIYINSKGNIKLGAFGSSKALTETMGKAVTMIGAIQAMSPEMIEGEPYDSKTDIWAVGCLLFELCTYRGVFSGMSLAEMSESILEARVQDLPLAYSKHLQPIYKKIMKKNPNLRPSAEQILRSPLFLKLMEEYLKKKRIDSIEIREIPVKKLKTHQKLKGKKVDKPRQKSKQKTILPTLVKRQNSQSAQKLSTPRTKQHPMKKSPVSQSKMPQIPLKREAVSKFEEEKQEQRLTKRVDENYEVSLEKLYSIQISIICKYLQQKYTPKMEQILEKTLEYDPQ